MTQQSFTVRAVLFDFDGTLADSFGAIACSVNHVRAARGLPPLPVAEVRRHVGRGPTHLIAETVPHGDIDHNEALYRAHHPLVMKEQTRLFSGTAEMLACLRERGLRLGICSNKPVAFTRALLEHLQVHQHFEIVLGPEDVPKPKPAPDMLLAGLQRLAVPASEALYVGDMTVDIFTARAAGVAVWVVPTGSETPDALQSACPDRLLDSLREIPHLL